MKTSLFESFGDLNSLNHSSDAEFSFRVIEPIQNTWSNNLEKSVHLSLTGVQDPFSGICK